MCVEHFFVPFSYHVYFAIPAILISRIAILLSDLTSELRRVAHAFRLHPGGYLFEDRSEFELKCSHFSDSQSLHWCRSYPDDHSVSLSFHPSKRFLAVHNFSLLNLILTVVIQRPSQCLALFNSFPVN